MHVLAAALFRSPEPAVALAVTTLVAGTDEVLTDIQLKEEFPDKLFVFISHARGKNPKGDAATSVMYDADLKIWVEGYVAFSKGRYQGATGEYTIWEKGAYDYWNVAGPKQKGGQA